MESSIRVASGAPAFDVVFHISSKVAAAATTFEIEIMIASQRPAVLVRDGAVGEFTRSKN